MADPLRTTRRGFLGGRGNKAEAGAAPLCVAGDSAAHYFLQLGRQAMACEFQLFMNAGQYAQATEQGVAALDRIDQLEDQLTIYREDSEVGVMNRLAAETPLGVEPNLFELLEFGKQIHEATDGAFDYTSGPLSEVWGFAKRAGEMPTEQAVQDALANVGCQHVTLDEYERSVSFEREGIQINLGGIGKGYALDCASEELQSGGIADFAFHGGNSSVLARGSSVTTRGWSVGLMHPLRPELRLGEFRIVDRALSTSGSGTQFFHHQGKRYGHIIDPRTGWPSQDVLSTTVLAPTAAEADALSTAMFVLTEEQVAAFCEQRPDVSVLVISPAKFAGGIDIVTFNFEDDLWTPIAAR